MKIGLIQYSPIWEDKHANKAKIENLLSDLNEDLSLLIFPELTLTGFTMHSDKFAESIEGESYNYFKTISKKFKVHILAGMIEQEEDNRFNTLFHISPNGELITKYRKIHPFSYSRENEFYQRGKQPVITEIENFKVGLSICYDLRFPELYRFYGKEKVDMMVSIANWPIARIEHWRVLLRARSIENQCYMVGVNRVGNDPKLSYNGYSSVFDPMGNEIVSITDQEVLISAELQKDKIIEVRKTFPFLEDIHLI
jgi:predicted amidohydrolase